MDLTSIISKLGLPVAITQDVTLFLVIAFLSFLFAMFIGRFCLITVLINFYVTLALLEAVPQKYLSSYSQEISFFLAGIIILTVLGKSLFEISISGAGKGYFFRVVILSFLEILAILSVIVKIFPEKKALGYISSSAYGYLISPEWQFVLLILPLIFLFLIRKRLGR